MRKEEAISMRFAMHGLVLLLVVSVGWAQTGGGALSTVPPTGRIGAINLQLAITSTAEGRKAAADLQSQFAPRYAELQDLQKQIDAITARLQAGQTSLSADEK